MPTRLIQFHLKYNVIAELFQKTVMLIFYQHYNLSPFDYFLWRYVKSKVNNNNPQSIPEIKNKISRVISETKLQLCQFNNSRHL